MTRLDVAAESKLTQFAQTLINQSRARIAVAPKKSAPGFWFGGGNLLEDDAGHLFLVGRYRNFGDSRTGIGQGERGLELAIFQSSDRGTSFEKVLSFSKADLTFGERRVVSIEGSALHWTSEGIELFVSTEKTGIDYPQGLTGYLKPGCGVWTIDRAQATSLDELPHARWETVLESPDPSHLHIKDPVVYDTPNGDLFLMFCTHPYCWSSSNTACALRPAGASGLEPPRFGFVPRGTTWDVAMTRGTCLVDVPRIGAVADRQVHLLFYDGGECVRDLEEHTQAVSRPRGFSCEELGGAAYLVDGDFDHAYRLSPNLPLFVSPTGTGCSRYVDVLAVNDGFFATWQQSQPDRSQPLVINFVSRSEAEAILKND